MNGRWKALQAPPVWSLNQTGTKLPMTSPHPSPPIDGAVGKRAGTSGRALSCASDGSTPHGGGWANRTPTSRGGAGNFTLYESLSESLSEGTDDTQKEQKMATPQQRTRGKPSVCPRPISFIIVSLITLVLAQLGGLMGPRHGPFFARRLEPQAEPAQQANAQYDLVVVLTVWKRRTLESYFEMLANQSLIARSGWRTLVVVFQNGEHVNARHVVAAWNRTAAWPAEASVDVDYIHSPIPTGYYGRFLVPLMSSQRHDGLWVVFDDDLVFGRRYLENLERVVIRGSLAVRVGRFVDGSSADAHSEGLGSSELGWKSGVQVTNDDDIFYDFGGQVWAGRASWLKAVWRHPPVTYVTCEDYWISAVLRTFYGIPTARPRCTVTDIEECACSMKVAHEHQPVEFGGVVGGETNRTAAIRAISLSYGYTPLGHVANRTEANAYRFHDSSTGLPFQLAGTKFEDCLYWI